MFIPEIPKNLVFYACQLPLRVRICQDLHPELRQRQAGWQVYKELSRRAPENIFLRLSFVFVFDLI